MKDLQSRTGCNIVIPSQKDAGTSPPSRTVSLIGVGDSTYNAKREIEEMLLHDNERNSGVANELNAQAVDANMHGDACRHNHLEHVCRVVQAPALWSSTATEGADGYTFRGLHYQTLPRKCRDRCCCCSCQYWMKQAARLSCGQGESPRDVLVCGAMRYLLPVDDWVQVIVLF